MGFQISNTPSKNAPTFEEGLVPARFAGMAMQNHPDWATANGKYGPDNGDRLHWFFQLLDDDATLLYGDDGDPIEVEATNSANLNTKSDKSKNAAWLKAVSAEAFRAVDTGTGFNADDLIGSLCVLLLEKNDKGWPVIANVLPATKKLLAAAAANTSSDEE